MYQNNSLDVKNKRVIIFGGLGILVRIYKTFIISRSKSMCRRST